MSDVTPPQAQHPASGFSVIIAAHNEAAVIEKTLRSVLDNRALLGMPLQIIVVANGCTDATADIARKVAPDIEVIESPVGNKIHALNLGDAAARFFPRAYLDADCAMSPNTLREVADAFANDPDARIVVPGVRHLYAGRNPVLAGYYALWHALPYVQRDMMGRGFYAIDHVLRSRFEEFPKVIADDKFIRSLSKPHERRVCERCHTSVFMPVTFRDLLHVKTRWSCGNIELAQQHPELLQHDNNPHGGTLRFLLSRPSYWVHVPTFLFVYLYTKRAARKRLASHRVVWARDASTRVAAPAA
jgi:glycosyltransferase involved in cell wall biosynthesis